MDQEQKVNNINVEGIPYTVARGLEAVVEMLRRELRHPAAKSRFEWPVKHGKVIGSLHRRDIYDDVD